MQGIKLQFDQNSIKQLKTDFDNIIKDMQDKASVKIDLSSLTNQINQISKTLAQNKIKIFDGAEIKKEGSVLYQTLEDVKKEFQNLGEVNFPSIFQDAEKNVTGFVMQLKKADGIIENFKFKGLNIADSSQTGFHKEFILDTIKSTDKTNDIAEKQAQKIQQINSKITKEQEKELEKQKKDREDYINWWIEQENRLEEAMANGREKVVKSSPTSNVDPQANAINKNLEEQYLKNQKELDRISKLGELKSSVPANLFDKTNDEIKEFTKSLYGADSKIVSFRKTLDSSGSSIIKMTVNTKNSKNEIQQETLILDKNTNSLYKNEEAIKANTARNVGYIDRLKNAFVAVTSFATITTAFYSAIKQLKEGIQFINTLNKSQTNIQMITSMPRKEIQGLTKDYSELADQLYTTTDAIMAGSEEFLRSGRSISETRNLLQASTIGGAISGQSNQEMSEQLIAISNGFKMATDDAKEMMGVIDTLSTLDNNSATSMKEISTAITRTASSAQMAGVSFKDLAAYISIVSSVSRKSSESIGESYKTIFSRFQDIKLNKLEDSEGEAISDVESTFNKLGMSIRKNATEFKDFSVVVDELKVKWAGFNDIERSAISKALAGTRQRENFLILMNNLDQVDELQKKVADSAGSAQKKFDEAYGNSTEAKVNKMKNQMQQLYMSIFNSDTINAVIGGFTNVLGVIDQLINHNKSLGITLAALTVAFVVLSRSLKGVGFAEYIAASGRMIAGVVSLGIATSATSAIMVGFTAVIKGITTALTFLFATPLGWITLLIAGVVGATMYMKKQREETEKLAQGYRDVAKAIKEVDIESQKLQENNLKQLQAGLDKAFANKQKGDVGSSTPNVKQGKWSTSGMTDTSGALDRQIEKIEALGYTVDRTTGKIVELTVVENNIGNDDAIQRIKAETEAIVNRNTQLENLIDRYITLNNTQERSKTQQEEMSIIARQLQGSIEGLVVAEDEQGRMIIKNVDILNIKKSALEDEKNVAITAGNAEISKQKELVSVVIDGTKITVASLRERVKAYKEMIELYRVDINAAMAGGYGSTYVDSKTIEALANLKKYEEILARIDTQLTGIGSVPISTGTTPSSSYIPPNNEDSKKKAEEAYEVIKTVEDKIKLLIEKQIENEKKALDERLKNYEDFIQKKLKALDDEYAAEDYKDQLAQEQKTKADLEAQQQTLLLDNSNEARIKKDDIAKEIEEQQKVIDNIIKQHDRETRKDNLNQQLEDERARIEKMKAELDAKFTPEQIEQMVKNSIISGTLVSVNGELINLRDAYMDFENKFGEGMSILGQKIKDEFLTKLQQAKDLMQSMGINGTISDTTAAKILGSHANGGVIDSTGLRMLHGTSSNPELVLNTAQASKVYDLFAFVKNMPRLTLPGIKKGGDQPPVYVSFDNLIRVDGDVNDSTIPKIQQITEQVMERFYTDLSKQGIVMSGKY